MNQVIGQAMNEELIQYNVYEEIGHFLDTIPFEKRTKSVAEYKKFLHLKHLMKDTETPAILSPSEIIDKVWHIHMLRPTMYQNFCQRVFGQNIDYDLAGSRSSDDEKTKKLERTKVIYKLAFSTEPDRSIWSSIEIKVKTAMGLLRTFECEPNDTVKSLKEKYMEKEGTLVQHQRLLCNNKKLENEKTLLHYKITKDDIVHVIILNLPEPELTD